MLTRKGKVNLELIVRTINFDGRFAFKLLKRSLIQVIIKISNIFYYKLYFNKILLSSVEKQKIHQEDNNGDNNRS